MKLWNDSLSHLMLEILGADDAAFVFVSGEGNIVSQTVGAERLLRQPPLRAVGEVLSGRAARAVGFVLDTGGESALEEEIDGHLYRLEIRPVQDGALLYFLPLDDRPSALPLGLAAQITGALSHILAVLHLLPESAEKKQALLLDDIRRSCLRIHRGLSHLELLENTDDPERLLRLHEHDLAALCRRLAEECRASCKARGIAVSIEVDAPVSCRVVYDEVLMTRAILNLLVNALHAPGAKRVRLGLHRADDRVIITVSDDGSGLAPEQLSRLYHNWERVQDIDDALLCASAIPGLGLPLVRRIAGWHSGALLLENGSAGGTIFHLIFADDLHSDNLALGQPEFSDTIDTAETELSVL